MRRHVRRSLLRLLDGSLSGARREAVERHLASCAECRLELAQLRRGYEAMRSLPIAEAPDGFTERVAERLRAGSSTRASELSRSRRRTAAIAAVWVLTLAGAGAAGYGAGSASGRTPTATSGAAADARGRFLLILLEADSMWPPRPGAARSGYGEWGRALREQGRYVVAEKLTNDQGTLVARNSAEPAGDRARSTLVSGYYIVRATGYDEAVAIAEGSPHLKYGGSILVRRIE